MIISGLEIVALNGQIDELLNSGKTKHSTPALLRAAWQVSSKLEDKMSDLNTPFDFFLKECIKNEQKQRNER